MPEIKKILEIPFAVLTLDRAVNVMIDQIATNSPQKPFFIATPNPEILLKTITDPRYKKLLQETDLNLADGTGILWAATYLSLIKANYGFLRKGIIAIRTLSYILFRPDRIRKILPERVSGSDVLEKLCSRLDSNTGVFLLGAQEGISSAAGKVLIDRYSLNIAGTYSGSPSPQNDQKTISLINRSGAKLLFVAFGAPNQEIWLKRNLPRLNTVRLAMGIGGTFDFISGKLKRAPEPMRNHGLEWLFRLAQQPSRLARIYRATIKFPWIIYRNSL